MLRLVCVGFWWQVTAVSSAEPLSSPTLSCVVLVFWSLQAGAGMVKQLLSKVLQTRDVPAKGDFIWDGKMLSHNLKLKFISDGISHVIFLYIFLLIWKLFFWRNDKSSWILVLSAIPKRLPKLLSSSHLTGNLLFSQCPLTVFKWNLEANYFEMEFSGLRSGWWEFGFLTQWQKLKPGKINLSPWDDCCWPSFPGEVPQQVILTAPGAFTTQLCHY